MATAVKTREYDLNVYVVDGEVRLSAYQYLYTDHPTDPHPYATRTDNDSWITLTLPLDPMEYGKEIAYLLDDPDWADIDGSEFVSVAEKWDDTDFAWESMSWLDREDTPELLREWANGLPEYEPRTTHEWAEAPLTGLDYGESREVACLNCDTTYTQQRATWESMSGLRGLK